MRTADPAAYNQFVEITSRTSDGTKLTDGFRGVFVSSTSTSGGSATLNIQYTVNGVLASAKTMVVSLPANGSIMLPISGDTIFCSSISSGFKIYALI